MHFFVLGGLWWEWLKRLWFVHFETQEAANKAIETMNGMLLNDRKV